jgi:hypothetical protein
MAKKWGKAVRKIKDSLHQQTEVLKSKIINNPVEKKDECTATPDVCIVRQTRRSEECLSCRSFVR